MPKCKHFEVCGLDDLADPGAQLCILHSRDTSKNQQAFSEALAVHRQNKGDYYHLIAFPIYVNFSEATFTKEVDFSEATFAEKVNFSEATFTKEVNFSEATFTKEVDFLQAMFAEKANFFRATFTKEVDFSEATFTKEVDFFLATFAEKVNFSWATFAEKVNCNLATFTKEVDFSGARFAEKVSFLASSFRGRTIFASRLEKNQTVPIFAGVEVDFRQVVVDPPDAITFIEADLRKCLFQDTDLREVKMIGVIWPKIVTRVGARFGVYDEIAILDSGKVLPWDRIERLYRELKQNYEDRRDYERAGDFHYGEKEIRRRNPATPRGLRVFLMLYWLSSGYGERYWRPLLWAGILLMGSAFGYLVLGLSPQGGGVRLVATNALDWLRALHYSLQVMTFLKPEDLVPLGYLAKAIKTIQSLLGPIFLGLFALALRQRLKR